jgi:hypothetical protein
VPSYPTQLDLPTLAVRLLDRLIVFVCKPGLDIADDDWGKYIAWVKAIQAENPQLNILTAPGGRAPTSAQRSLLNRELDTDQLRLAVLLSDPKLVVIVKVSSWFMRSAQPFRAGELDKALAYLGETNLAGVRLAIRELGGSIPNAVAP